MMTNDLKSRQRCQPLRAIILSLCVGTSAIACSINLTGSTTPVEPSAERYCADWASESFPAPSPAQDEAFIDCIVRRNPSATTNVLRHRLATGDGDNLLDRLMAGEDPPITSDYRCPFVRVAVESPAGSDDAYQKPMRDLFSTALARAGFKVVEPDTTHKWWASSLAFDAGVDPAAWTVLVRAVPEIGRGEIEFTSVRKTVSGREGSFTGMQLLRVFSKAEAPEVARLAAEGIARELLPAAHRRCNVSDGTLDGVRTPLEQLRSELVDEIESARRKKARREEAGDYKQLQIEVEG
jgi:hypothetical protein